MCGTVREHYAESTVWSPTLDVASMTVTSMKSIADHVAAGDSLQETANALGVPVDDVRRWAHEMMAVLQVDSTAALADRLRTMQYGDGRVREWRRDMFTQREQAPVRADSAIA